MRALPAYRASHAGCGGTRVRQTPGRAHTQAVARILRPDVVGPVPEMVGTARPRDLPGMVWTKGISPGSFMYGEIS
jgi:hypothetical protein